MADYRFKIEKEHEPLNLKLNIVLFLSGQSQFLKDSDRKSQKCNYLILLIFCNFFIQWFILYTLTPKPLFAVNTFVTKLPHL